MIKGARKQMIVVRTGNSRYFDEAYFVLREEAQKENGKSTDILSEANRLLAEMTPELSPAVKNQNRQWLFFRYRWTLRRYFERCCNAFARLMSKVF